MYQISLIAAFVAGMVALFAPCCISYLLPTYLGSIFREKRAVLGMTIIYSLGIATIILPVVFGARLLASFFTDMHDITYAIGGSLLLITAWLSLLGIKLPMPHFSYSPKVGKDLDIISTYTMGLIAGITSSCCAPVLLGVITLSALTPDLAQSIFVSLAYVAGMVAPLYVAALFVDKTNVLHHDWWKKVVGKIKLGTRTYPLIISNLVAAAVFGSTGVYLLVALVQGKLAMEAGGAQAIYQVATNVDAMIKVGGTSMLTLIVNLSVIALIIFVYWFFFGKKINNSTLVKNGQVKIQVAGGYQPNHIVVKKGSPVTLVFHRTDSSDCLEEVVIPEFGIREHLPVGKDHEIIINPDKLGTYTISCGMNMYHAKIEVK